MSLQLAHDRVLCRSSDLAVLNHGFPQHQIQLLDKAERKVGRRAVCTAVTLFLELNQTVMSVFARNSRSGQKGDEVYYWCSDVKKTLLDSLSSVGLLGDCKVNTLVTKRQCVGFSNCPRIAEYSMQFSTCSRICNHGRKSFSRSVDWASRTK